MYDHLTSNISFIDLCDQLKNEGIKNCDWMLYLKNENLINLDPYSNNLSVAEKCDIIKECYENPIYFFREVVRVPTHCDLSSFKIYKGTAPKIYCWINNVPTLTLLHRQSFKTHTSIALAVYEFLFNNNQTILIQSKSVDEMYDRMKMFSEMINLLPDYIRAYKEYNPTLKRQCSLLVNKVSNNVIHIGHSIRNSEESFINAATGIGNNTIILFDNIVESQFFHKFIKEIAPLILENKIFVDFNSIYSEDSIALRHMWNSTHWNDMFYDITIDHLTNIGKGYIPQITIHYEPEEVLTKKEIEHNNQVLCNDSKLIRQEMCIKPFDTEYKE